MPNIANQIGCFLAAQSHMEHLCGKVPRTWGISPLGIAIINFEASFGPGHPLRWFRHAQWLCQPPVFDAATCGGSHVVQLYYTSKLEADQTKVGITGIPQNLKPADL